MSNQVQQQPEPPLSRAVKALKKLETDVTGYLGNHRLDSKMWKRSAVRAMERAELDANKNRRQGDPWAHIPAEMMKAAYLEAAAEGLEPGRHCYFIFYKGKNPDLKVLTSYQGAFERVNNLEGVVMLPPVVVRQDDVFKFEPTHFFENGTVGPRIVFEPDLEEKSAPIGLYVVWKIGDQWHADWVSKRYMMLIKNSVRSGESPWKGPFEAEMWRKTAVHHAAKYIPKGLVLLSGDRLPDVLTAEDAEFTDVEESGPAALAHQASGDPELEQGLRDRALDEQADRIAERAGAPVQREQAAAEQEDPPPPAEAKPEEELTEVAKVFQHIDGLPDPAPEFVKEVENTINRSDLTDDQKKLAHRQLAKKVKDLRELDG